MSDIININIGQAGIRIADQFTSILRQEHAIGQPQQHGNMAFFQQKSKGWQARSIFIDTDDRAINKIRSRNDTFFDQFDFISTPTPSRSIYPEGAYLIYPDIQSEVEDRIRRRVQGCDSLSGFLIFSTLGGGASSGVGGKVSTSIRQHYPDRMIQSVKLFPNTQQTNPLEIYNSAYSIKQQIQYCDMSLLFENSSILRKLSKQQCSRPSIQEQNYKIAASIAESTIPYRFSGSLNTSQRKIATNLVLFPRMHFLPFSIANSSSSHNPLLQALSPHNLSLSNYYESGGKVFNIYAGAHDHFTNEQQINNTINSEYNRSQIKFVDWTENVVHLSIHPPVSKPSASILVNGYNMKTYFEKISSSFTASFRRRAFLCWYRGVGLDEMQFTEIQSNLNDLISEYTPYTYNDYDDEIEDLNESQYVQ